MKTRDKIIIGASILGMLLIVACITLAGCGGITYRPDLENGFMHDAAWTDEQMPLRIICAGYTKAADSECRHIYDAAHAWNERIGELVFVPAIRAEQSFQVVVVVGLPLGSPHSDFSDRNRHEYESVIDFHGQTILERGNTSFATLRWSNRTFQDCYIGIVSSIQNVELLHRVAVHELGHCLNLQHDDYRSSIMYWRLAPSTDFGWPPRISDYDRSIIRDLYVVEGF